MTTNLIRRFLPDPAATPPNCFRGEVLVVHGMEYRPEETIEDVETTIVLEFEDGGDWSSAT